MFTQRHYITLAIFSLVIFLNQSVYGQLYSTEFSDTSFTVVQSNGNVKSSMASFGINKNSGGAEIILEGAFPTISFLNLQIGHKGSNEMGIDGDIVPFQSVTYDLGNVVFDEHWDQVVAQTFVTYPPANLKSMTYKSMDNVLNNVLQLQPLSYSNTKSTSTVGFDINDLEKYLPSVLVTEDYDYDTTQKKTLKSKTEIGINYDAFIPVLVKAIQEQTVLINNLSGELELLKAQINQ